LAEHRVLRKIFGTKVEEVTGNWAKLQVQEFFFQIHENKMEGAPGPYEYNRNACKVSERKSARRRSV
jgi:hypothetical protein